VHVASTLAGLFATCGALPPALAGSTA